MPTLITGGAGFVALNVAEALLRQGEEVVVFDSAEPWPVALEAWRTLPGRLRSVTADVRDPEAIARAVAASGADAVVHGAAITSNVERERRAAREIVEVNVLGTLAVIEALRRQPVRRLVLLSSVAVYGHVDPDRGPLDEAETCPRPNSLYGISKYAAEACALRADELEPLNLVVARLGPVFGPWERATGTRDTLSPHLQVAYLAAGGDTAILAQAGHGDWLYSRDAAAGVVALLAADRPRHRVYNVGAGRRWPVTAWCERLAIVFPGFQWRTAAAADEANVRFQPARERAPLAIERLTAEFGCRPAFDVDRAFADFDAWLQHTPDALAARPRGGRR